MGKLKDMIDGQPVHERRLEFRSYPVDDDRLVVEGWLRDERLVPGFHWNGHPRAAGVIHHICVRILVGGWPLSILEAEAEMPDIPHELCPTTLDSVQRIVGLSIISGFSEKVRTRLGGIKGCTHMTALIIAMGPAALHGYWTQRSREKRPAPHSFDEVPGLAAVINSCALWKEDGPLMQLVRESFENLDEPAE